MKNLLLFFLSAISFSVYGQADEDSLQKVWKSTTVSAENRVKAVYSLVRDHYQNFNPDTALILTESGLKLSKQLDNKNLIGSGLLLKAHTLRNLGQLEASFKALKKAEVLFSNMNDSTKLVDIYVNQSTLLGSQGNTIGSVDLLDKSLKLSRKLDYSIGIARSISSLAILYWEIKDIETSRKYYEEALKLDVQKIRGTSFQGLGILYEYENKFDSARVMYDRAIEQYNTLGQLPGVVSTYCSLGELNLKTGDLKSAYGDIVMARDMSIKSDFQPILSQSLVLLSRYYYAINKYDLGIKHGLDALAISESLKVPSLSVEAYKELYKNYKIKGNHFQAMKMLERQLFIDDSLKSTEQQKYILGNELVLQYEKKTLSDSLNNVRKKVIGEQLHKNEIDHLNRQRYLLMFGFFALVGIVALALYLLQKRKKINKIIAHQKVMVETKNLEITDSINYAQKVQTSILPSEQTLNQHLPDHFLFYQPKDIVGGDFYFLEKTEDGVIFAIADCTGHGVPGAIVSVVCHNALNQSVKNEKLTDPGKILDRTKSIVSEKFTNSNSTLNDGMDIAICRLQGDKLFYAGANMPFWLVRDNEVEIVSANKQPIGNYPSDEQFTTHTMDLLNKDMIYLFSDGYQDQFGGEFDKKFGRKRLRELFKSCSDLSTQEQMKRVMTEYKKWKLDNDQVDDICVLGICIG